MLLQPTMEMDSSTDASGDILDVSDHLDTQDDAPTTYPTNICRDVAESLFGCGWYYPSPDAYGCLCAHMSGAARQCATEPADPEYACACLRTLEPYSDCDDICCTDICVYLSDCFSGPLDTCEYICNWSSTTVLDCIRAALTMDDCPAALSCLECSAVAVGCDQICDMAVGCEMGVDATTCPAACESATTAELEGAIIRTCLWNAFDIGDCEALAACGGLGL